MSVLSHNTRHLLRSLVIGGAIVGGLTPPAVAQTASSSIPAAFRGTWHEEPNTRCSPNEGGFLTVTAQGYESPVAEGSRFRVQTVSPTNIRIRYSRSTEEGGSRVAASEVWTLRDNGRHLHMADARPGATLDTTDLYRCTPRRGR